MNYLGTITSKRQLTIPSGIFHKVGLSEGDKVLIEEKEGELRIKKASVLVENLAGSVTIPKYLKGKDVDEAIEIAKKKHFSKRST